MTSDEVIAMIRAARNALSQLPFRPMFWIWLPKDSAAVDMARNALDAAVMRIAVLEAEIALRNEIVALHRESRLRELTASSQDMGLCNNNVEAASDG
jgi:hypothetical protein